MTSFPLGINLPDARLRAFWVGDDYYIRADDSTGTEWYRFDLPEQSAPASLDSPADRVRLGRLMSDIIPLGGGRVAFPVGSTGRTVFRVWRSRGDESVRAPRTKILAIRAGRSRRLPA